MDKNFMLLMMLLLPYAKAVMSVPRSGIESSKNSSRRTEGNFNQINESLQNLRSLGKLDLKQYVSENAHDIENTNILKLQDDTRGLQRSPHVFRQNPSFAFQGRRTDLASLQSQQTYSDVPGVYYDNGFSSNHPAASVIHEEPEFNNRNIIKNKLGGGIQGNFGNGWDGAQGGFHGGNIGSWINGGGGGGGGGLGGFGGFHGGNGGIGGGGLAEAAGLLAVKKTAGAKALFVLMVPLILLAVFGPILASQSMIPWAITGGSGLASVSSTVAGKRRRRAAREYIRSHQGSLDPRQIAELEKRLRVFMAVQEYIASSGSDYTFQDDATAAYLQCQGYMDESNMCMERVACEYADKSSNMNGIERRITGMVLQNIMSSRNLPASIKGRLSKGAMFGRSHPSRCTNYYCAAVDGQRNQRISRKE